MLRCVIVLFGVLPVILFLGFLWLEDKRLERGISDDT